MELVTTMVPVFGIIALGAGLAKIGFLTETLVSGLNRIVYYVAVPTLATAALAGILA